MAKLHETNKKSKAAPIPPNLGLLKSRYESIQWLKERCGDWKSPTVVYKDPGLGAGYEPLKCNKMDVSAIVSLHGQWKNDSIQNHFIFVLSGRGSITNCTIKVVGKNNSHSHVRTVAVIASDQIRRDTQAVEWYLRFNTKNHVTGYWLVTASSK